MILSNLTLLIVFSIFYVLGLSFFYFSKSRIDNRENKIYMLMLSLNLFGLVLQLMCDLVSFQYNIFPTWFSNFILKIYLIYFIMFILLMALYVIGISFKKVKLANAIMISLGLFFSIILLFLPIELFRDVSNKVYYSLGTSVNYTYIISGLMSSIIFLILIYKRKEIPRKKALPIYIFLIMGLGIMIIQMVKPGLVITTVMESLICFLMYFTIENPDVKVIEQLNIAKNIAEKANMAKSDFLSSMSHEIRTPLNAIVGLSEDIAGFTNLPEEVMEDSQDIVIASNTLLEIIGNILDINKIESQKLELVKTKYNPKLEIETLSKVLITRIGDKPINFNKSFAPDLPYELYGDKIHIKQIINNLLSNAIKYTDKGNITLTVKCINKKDICLLIISVQDTGRGIKEEDINRLFTKFERLDIEKNSTTEGTGLGLAITKKIVEIMNGTINVKSQFGTGSLFVVQVPQKISQLNDIPSNKSNKNVIDESPKNIHNYKNKKVLIVDDNALNIKVAKRALKDYNFIFDECENGQLCLDKINSGFKYDLILMDIMMPVMGGDTALHKLKENKDFHTPVIALTADAVAGREEKYIKDGFVDYIAKPFTKEDISIKLEKIFNIND